jgi:hypothetical protein
MSQSPTELAKLEASAQSVVSNSTSWILQHERLIIIVLVLALLGWGTEKAFDLVASRDKQAATLTAQTLAAQQQKDQELSQAVAQTTAQYQALVQTLTQQNTQLATAVSARNKALTVQQTTDTTLTPSQLTDRWANLAKVDSGKIAVSGDTIVVTPDAALDTVQQLEQVPVLTLNLEDETTQLTNTKSELASANQAIGQQKADITGLTAQIADQKKADATELAAEKAAARKSKLKWFGAGFVAGFIAGHIW